MSVVCRHFGLCGGCAFQDLPSGTYRALKRTQVEKALARHGVSAPVAPLIETAPATRRRASLSAAKSGKEVSVGFNAIRSHTVVDMQECHVITPAMLSLVPELRGLLQRLLKEGEEAKASLTETDSGFDLALDLPARDFVRSAAFLAQWAAGRNIARVSVNGEIAVHLVSPAVRIGEVDVLLPRNAFLQPSREGERILQTAVLELVQGARRIADLFAGCGTFSLVLAQRARVHAVDLDGEALKSLSDAARKAGGMKPVTTETRDLFRRPLRPEELNAFDAIVIDPPRSGAQAHAELIGQSRVGRLIYVSCNPESFARDAAILTQRGFCLSQVRPVDQFLWSKHVELVGAFERLPE
jgi:23S rRNA (uracil1939-C5)-methyltransferase